MQVVVNLAEGRLTADGSTQGHAMPMYSPNHTYRLILSDDQVGSAKTMEFEALSVESALHQAQRLCLGREAELFEDGRSLGRVRCAKRGGYWMLSESPAVSAGAV